MKTSQFPFFPGEPLSSKQQPLQAFSSLLCTYCLIEMVAIHHAAWALCPEWLNPRNPPGTFARRRRKKNDGFEIVVLTTINFQHFGATIV